MALQLSLQQKQGEIVETAEESFGLPTNFVGRPAVGQKDTRASLTRKDIGESETGKQAYSIPNSTGQGCQNQSTRATSQSIDCPTTQNNGNVVQTIE